MAYLTIFTLLLYCCDMRNIVMAEEYLQYNFTITFDDKNLNLEEDVRFFLYTRAYSENPQQLWVDNIQMLNDSTFNSSHETKFMTHGYQNSYKGNNCITVRKAFLARGDYNVIVVDWSNVANLPYLDSAGKLKACGAHIARMINFLVKQGAANPNNMTLVGHSLGAQLMGFAGYQAVNKVGHLVGLDPARPGFVHPDPTSRISPLDAQVVEVIHTNSNYFGLAEPVGHLDYYPNGGGIDQPGCTSDPNPKYYCAHDRAYYFYAEAITRPEGLLAVKCKDYQEFLNGGYDEWEVLPFPGVSQKGKLGKKGSYCLRTSDQAPFGLGYEGLKPRKTD